MNSQLFSACATSILFLCGAASPLCGQTPAQDEKSQNPMPPSSKVAASNPASSAKPSPAEELQQAISKAGNDRAALVRNLEAFLKEYPRSEEHTSELQSRLHLVCRLLLENKNTTTTTH